MTTLASGVDILLATFNGERFLSDQLRSIEQQSYRAWRVVARDDGSTDATRAILADFRRRHSAMAVLVEDDACRLGPLGNFHRLLQRSQAPYALFCDQDDVWRTDKIERLLELARAQENPDVPVLAHSDLEVVDGNLRPLGRSFWRYQHIDPAHCRWPELVVQNVVTGCACLINSALRRAALPIPPEAIMHDWWLALVAATSGEIRWTHETTMQYRQHGRNDTGAKEWGPAQVFRQAVEVWGRGAFRKKVLTYQRQAGALAGHDSARLPAHTRAALKEFAAIDTLPYPRRVGLLLRHKILKTGWLRNFAMFAFI